MKAHRDAKAGLTCSLENINSKFYNVLDKNSMNSEGQETALRTEHRLCTQEPSRRALRWGWSPALHQ